MALTQIRFDIVGDVQYSRGFQLMAREAEDLSEPLREIGESLLHAIGSQFRTEGVFGLGQRWQALSSEYEAWKQSSPYAGNPMLVLTGKMRREMLARNAFQVFPRRLVYEPNAPEYALVHQEGEGSMPQRKMVALPGQTRRGWDRIFAEWLNGLRHSLRV